MSEYYNYYLASREKSTGKIFPLGPFDSQGEYKPVFWGTRSYDTGLSNDFYLAKDEEITDELFNAIFTVGNDEYEAKREECLMFSPIRYRALKDLPSGDYIKEGYFLIEDVERYLNAKKAGEWGVIDELLRYEIFFDHLEKEVYTARLVNEMVLGPGKDTSDDFDSDEEPREISMKDYMLFAFPDTTSMAYDVHRLKIAAESYDDYDYNHKLYEMVVVEVTT